MKTILLLSLSLFIAYTSYAQDSTKWKNTLLYEVKAFHNQLTAGNDNKSIFIDNAIHERRVGLHEHYTLPKEYSNQPFRHFATYTGIFLQSSYQSKYQFLIGGYLEHRSASAGIHNTKNILVYPRISITINDTFFVKSKPFKVKATIGSHYQADFEDFLRLYNIDVQAVKLKIGFGDFWLNFSQIGDLSRTIGLGITEHGQIGLSYKKEKFTLTTNVEGNWLTFIPRLKIHINTHFVYKVSDNYTFKAQLNKRLRYESLSGAPIALGLSNNLSFPNLDIQLNARYYGQSFNTGHFWPWNINYRTSLDDYIGETQFYPLKNYFRSFNQWAVFVEYGGRRTGNIELRIDYSKQLRKKLWFNAVLDYNLIFVNQTTVHYPIVQLGLELNLVEDFSLQFILSNKFMNLDVHYETFYVAKRLFPGLLIQKRIKA